MTAPVLMRLDESPSTLDASDLARVRGGIIPTKISTPVLAEAINYFRRSPLFPSDIAKGCANIADALENNWVKKLDLNKARPLLNGLSLRQIADPFRNIVQP